MPCCFIVTGHFSKNKRLSQLTNSMEYNTKIKQAKNIVIITAKDLRSNDEIGDYEFSGEFSEEALDKKKEQKQIEEILVNIPQLQRRQQ